jgi:hypothetical protein
MELHATTSVKCGASKTANGTHKHHFADKGTVLGLQSPITLPSDPDAEALDVGAFLALSLHPQHAYARGKPLHRFGPISPSFITYNIKHSHELRWELTLEVAGESITIIGQQPVFVLAASS